MPYSPIFDGERRLGDRVPAIFAAGPGERGGELRRGERGQDPGLELARLEPPCSMSSAQDRQCEAGRNDSFFLMVQPTLVDPGECRPDGCVTVGSGLFVASHSSSQKSRWTDTNALAR